ncbi:branched-chain alpha-keto acid dehydrogenase subunit E2 [Agrilactobacillus composti DSM 18527 = JCM 14202]|uniref:Dihydrolipoamide acetyltransferase component of pyruvate dehydrogenase complex n=1 Tax=Agrilactobacillus composti DSM 18527 = JCM 14202 TaxID=1423734 RepID=X0PHU6_9LACO|nr:dihydrolipoamide acetyltransferase family protein [Agrilactobacillus composti]KRM30864.1 branched-chain alpha-keto acid dehydrogenase subunit E2 [Agrilactobacillus composti DSM 18527 = JCM 14202]GAF41739.1 dihydrolipoamide acetyltransferase component of acetoin dehydrogenase complex [Agrilactobacillus composti DSM 18527 = JCM 14202]
MATAIVMPKLGLTMTEGTVVSWDKQVGDAVKEGDVLATIASEKLTYDVEAPASGVITEIVAQEGDEVPIKEPIGYIGAADEAPAAGGSAAPEPAAATPATAPSTPAPQVPVTPVQAPVAPSTAEGARIFITPLAKKIAADKGIDYTQIQGTGGHGRITRRDVANFTPSAQPATPEPVAAPVAPATPATTSGVPGYVAGAGLTGMRQVIAKNMMHSVQTTATVTLQRRVNITALMAFRSELKGKFTEPLADGQLSLTTLLARAVILALQATPEMNAWYQDGTYTKVEDVNIGLAVGLPDGLIVPVVKQAQNMNLTLLGRGLKDKASRAQDGKLKPDEYTGSTFTITNLGHEHIEYFTPIINSPEIGILGVGALQQQLVLDDQQKVIAQPELPLSLTFDHQIIDGQQAAIFLDKIANYLQAPYQLIL